MKSARLALAAVVFLAAGAAAVSCVSKNRKPSSEAWDPVAHKNAIWALDPMVHGQDLPPAGRSAFDQLITVKRGAAFAYEVPFPFNRLLEKIRDTLTPSADDLVGFESGILGVHLPRGRSLQRNTQFHSPRVVVAVNGEPRQEGGNLGLLLKNRLYIGYSEEVGTLEIISYNEEAGRYEYQLVKNYQPGGTPQIFYANRAVCLQCHQNQAPLFSEADWKETNAFKPVQDRLLAEIPSTRAYPSAPPDRVTRKEVVEVDGSRFQQTYYYGVPIIAQDAMPYSIDQATDEGNYYGVYHQVWKEGCDDGEGMSCRAEMLKFMLRYFLSGHLDARLGDYDAWVRKVAQTWMRRWPDGLKVPSPDIPNRNPFTDVTTSGQGASRLELEGRMAPGDDRRAIEKSDVPAHLEPLNFRNPLLVWRVTPENTVDINSAVIGLTKFLTNADQKRLDARLFELGQRSERRRVFQASCSRILEPGTHPSEDPELTEYKLTCDGEPQDLGAAAPDASARAVFGGSVTFRKGEVVGSVPVFSVGPNRGDCSLDPRRMRGNPRACRPNLSGRLTKQANGTVVMKLEPWEKTAGVRYRLADGNAVESIEITWMPGRPESGRVKVTVIEDFRILAQAVERISANERVFGLVPFKRNEILELLYKELGLRTQRFGAGTGPAGQLDNTATEQELRAIFAANPELKPFFNNCAECHNNSIGKPPNWLFGRTVQEINSHISECAERLYYRVTRWDNEPARDPVKEMRPRQSVENLGEWHRDRAQITAYLLKVLGMTRDQARTHILARDYQSFKPCRKVVEGQ